MEIHDENHEDNKKNKKDNLADCSLFYFQNVEYKARSYQDHFIYFDSKYDDINKL